jgi:hypothetical protein
MMGGDGLELSPGPMSVTATHPRSSTIAAAWIIHWIRRFGSPPGQIQ